MFVPEAYITATRQFVAQANNWSLEELALEVSSITKWHRFFLFCLFPFFVCSCVCSSFVRVFVRLFVCSFVCSFVCVCSCVRVFL